MGEFTAKKALRLFWLTELAGLAIAAGGVLLDMNGYIISAGLLLMLSGFIFLSAAGAIKAQERWIDAAERAVHTERQQADLENEDGTPETPAK